MTGQALRLRARTGRAPDIRFLIALLVACALHAAAILGIDLPAPDDRFGTRALDIRLTVQSPPASFASSLPEPLRHSNLHEPAAAIPDTGQRAAGEAGYARGTPKPETRLPDSGQSGIAETSLARDGTANVDSQPHAARIGKLVTKPEPSPAYHGQSARKSTSPDLKTDPATGKDSPDYSELAKAIASAYTSRDRSEAFEAGGTRTKRLTSTSAKSPEEAAYLEMWRQKVERVGRANYPPGGLAGELLLLAVIRRDGSLLEARILESSRHPALDAAAIRTVRLAAPFSHFPTEMRKSYDELEIVRRWRYAREGALLR